MITRGGTPFETARALRRVSRAVDPGTRTSVYGRALSAIRAFDFRVSSVLTELNRGPGRIVTRAFSALGSERVFVPAALAMAALAAFYGEYCGALVIAASALITRQLARVLKQHLWRRRPEISKLVSGSFPSGHTMAGVAVYGTAAQVLAGPNVAIRNVVIIGALGLGLVIGMSRVARGYHWVSDVFAALALGMAILALMMFGIG